MLAGDESPVIRAEFLIFAFPFVSIFSEPPNCSAVGAHRFRTVHEQRQKTEAR
jgi:hypothetical protein